MQLLSQFPSATTMVRFRQQIRSHTVAEHAAVARVGRNSWQGMSASFLLRWVKATAFIKRLKDHKEAAVAFAELLDDSEYDHLGQVMPQSKVANGEVLRKARVRTDIVAMLIFRLAFSCPQMQENASFYLWSGSSPQWRGR